MPKTTRRKARPARLPAPDADARGAGEAVSLDRQVPEPGGRQARAAARAPGLGAGEEVLPATLPEARASSVLAWLHRQVAQILELDPARVEAGRSLVALGLDSLSAAELTGAIESGLGV